MRPGPRTAGGQALAAAAAQRYYLERASKVQIARQLGVSRFKVARLLDDALAAGLVTITVRTPASLDGELAEAVRARFGTAAVYVVRPEEETLAGQRRAVARFTAGLLDEIVTADDVVGLTWGWEMSSIAPAVHGTWGCRIVQLAGALPHPDVTDNAVEVVRRMSASTGSSPVTFYAPLAVPDDATADGLRSQPEIAAALAEHDHLSRAVVSVGAWRPGQSTAYDGLDPAERDRLAERGLLAEVCGIAFAGDGSAVDALEGRRIGVRRDQLAAVPDLIALACGDDRPDALSALLRSGIVDTLVTHTSLARSVLAQP